MFVRDNLIIIILKKKIIINISLQLIAENIIKLV